MIGEKVQQFKGKGTDLSALNEKIAKKGGFLSGVIAADRALSILVSGDSNDFTVRIGIGKWLEHLGVAALETLLLSDLFLVVDVAEMAWNLEIESKLAKQIESLVG